MKIDALNEFCDNTVLIATAAVVGDVIDNRNPDGTVRQIGAGTPVYVFANVQTALAGAASTNIDCVTADDAALSTNAVVLATSGTVLAAAFIPGKVLLNFALPNAGLKAYIGIRQGAATSYTAGKIDAFIAKDVPMGKVAAKSNVSY